MDRTGRKKNIPLRLASVLLCLTLLSSYLAAGLFAQYTTSGTGNDAARVAGFQPAAKLDPADVMIIYDADETEYEQVYHMKLSNLSEVAVTYDLEISFADQTLNGATFTFGGDEKTITGSGSSPSDSLSFSGADVLPANTTETTKELTLTVGQSFMDALLAATAGSEMDLTSLFVVEVIFTQVD